MKEILVVKKEIIFKDEDFQGFIPIEKKDFTDLILKNFEYRERNNELENNASFKQIIPYVIIINPETKKVFGYKRFKLQSGIHETRLHNRFSFGIGGHIDKGDDETNIINAGMIRELKEEVKMDNYPLPKIVGFVNDDLNQVGSVHFGVIALALTEEKVEKMEDEEVKEERFYSVEEINELINSKEQESDPWTRICWPFIKSYLENLN
jgi:predicted NUDIX family phosphoesterase